MKVGEARDYFRSHPREYARACLKIVPKEGPLRPLAFNFGQRLIDEKITALRARGRPPRIVVLKARRLGVSTLAQSYLFGDCHLNDNRQALVIAHKFDSARALFRMSQLFYRHLPKALKWKKKADNRRELHFEKNDSRLQVEVAGEGAGRGYSVNYLHLSEMAFVEEPEALFTAAVQTVPYTVDSLVIVESTPNGVGNFFHDLWVNAKTGHSEFEAVFLPWFCDPENRLALGVRMEDLDDAERELVERHGLTAEQLAWRRQKIATDFNGDAEKFLQEMPSDDHSCFISSGRRVFPTGDVIPHRDGLLPLEELDKAHPRIEIDWDATNAKPVLREVDQGRLRIYRKPEPRLLYTGGIDPSAGDGPALPRPGDSGSDPTPIVIVNRMDLWVDAVWWGRSPPETLAEHSAALGRYYNTAMLNPEVNNHGISLVARLDEIYPNIYWRLTDPDSATRQPGDKLGFKTTSITRDYLINNVRVYLRQRLGRIPDPQLVAELEWMVYVPNATGTRERADHPRGKTGDCVIALGLALAAHKEYAEAPLLPLTQEDLSVASAEFERVLVTEGQEAALQTLDRFGLTADELERYDQMVYERGQRLREQGYSEAV